jgi:hypothetical protein
MLVMHLNKLFPISDRRPLWKDLDAEMDADMKQALRFEETKESTNMNPRRYATDVIQEFVGAGIPAPVDRCGEMKQIITDVIRKAIEETKAEVMNGSYPDAFDADGRAAPHEVKHMLWKVAEQAGKQNWWNVLNAVSELEKICRGELRKAVNQ